MIWVNNKQTIRKLAGNTFRANKMRNLFAVLAIMLTTVLFTTLFTSVSSLITSIEESYMRQVGGSTHGGFKRLTEEEYERLSTHDSIKSISYTVILAAAENEELKKRKTEIRFANDEMIAESFFALPTVGRMPKADNELATDTLVLEQLGIPCELGQEVTLEYSVGETHYADTFTLVGYWEGDVILPASQVWLNRNFVELRLEQYEPMYEGDYIGMINADFYFDSSTLIEEKIIRVIEDSGYTTDEIDYGVNWAYIGNSDSTDMGMVLGAFVVGLLVMFCGYLMISNVFAISIEKDIRYYGLLKTVGTTAIQIRNLIYRQALWLCLIGIPLGMLVGYWISIRMVPLILSTLTVNVIRVSLSPLLFVATAMYGILTVFFSVSKPSKVAGRVSPIEALRTNDGEQTEKEATRKSGGVSIWRMALSNMMRNKKKMNLVVTSLSLSLIILNATYSLANNFDMESYLEMMISNDFVAADVSYFNVYSGLNEKKNLDKGIASEFREAAGIETLNQIYFQENVAKFDERLKELPAKVDQALDMGSDWIQCMQQEIDQKLIIQHAYGLDVGVWEHMTVYDGRLDLEKLSTGEYVVVSPYDHEGKVFYYQVGDKVQITTADKKQKEYEVLAVASLPYNMSIRHSHYIPLEFYLPGEIFVAEIADVGPLLITLDMADEYKAEMEAFLEEYCSKINPNVQYESREAYIEEFEDTQRAYRIVGIVLSILLAVIGMMNFANTIITSIFARKREIAMLQSIGMTGKQVNRLLVSEGLFYTIFTVAFALTVGTAIGMAAVSLLSGAQFLTMNYTVIPSLVCIPFLVILSGLIPYFSQRMMRRKSVVERLRECE